MAAAKVVILGGGVAGLTAAHELIDRGFAVDIYEKTHDLGGKAKSNTKVYSGGGAGLPLPGEHGFRFFPGFYQHLPDTMSRIPSSANTVVDNLVIGKQSAIAQEMKPLFIFLTHIPKTLQDWILIFDDWFNRLELGLKSGEPEFFASRLLNFMSTCNKRRLAELENVIPLVRRSVPPSVFSSAISNATPSWISQRTTSGPSRTTPNYAPPISGARAFTDAEPQRNRQLLWSQPHPEPAVTSGRRGRIHGDSRPQWYWQDHVVEDLDGAD